MSSSLWLPGLYSPWSSSGQNTGVDSLSLLQGIFLTQELNHGLLHCRWILYQLSYQGSPFFSWISRSDQRGSGGRVSGYQVWLQCGTLQVPGGSEWGQWRQHKGSEEALGVGSSILLSLWLFPLWLFPPSCLSTLNAQVLCLLTLTSTHTLSSVQFSCVWIFATPWTAAHQASLSITNSQSLLKLMSIESVMPSNHLILCHPLLLLPSIFPSIRVFSSESVLRIRWPKYWRFSFSISPSSEYSGLISFRIDWLDLLAVQETLKSLLQHHSSKASILQHSVFFIVQL